MRNFLILFSIFFASSLAAQDDIEKLLREADRAIEKQNVPLKPSPRKKQKPIAPKAKPEVTRSEEKEKTTPEIGYTSDPALAKMLDLDVGSENVSRNATSKMMWSLGFVSLKNQSYVLEKDDDTFTSKPNQSYLGLAINLYPLLMWEEGNHSVESTFGLSFFNPKVETQRTGLVERSSQYTHRIVNFDFGMMYWREVYSNWNVSAGAIGSIMTLMQDGDEDNDTIFDLSAGYGGSVGIHRRIVDDWSIGLSTLYRDLSLGGSKGALNGVSYTIAIEHGNRSQFF